MSEHIYTTGKDIFDGETDPNSIIGVGAIVEINPGKYVFIEHTKLQRLTIPVGSVEQNESPLNAIIREMGEEIGITLYEKMIIPVVGNSFVSNFKSPTGKAITQRVLVFFLPIGSYSGEIIDMEFEIGKSDGMNFLTLEQLNQEIQFKGLSRITHATAAAWQYLNSL